MMKLRETYTCPLELVHDMLRGKWKTIILWRLRLGPTSLSKLERDISGINQKMLLEQLRELMECDFIEKKTYEGYPLKVEYSLKEPQGTRLLEALEILQEIGIAFMEKDNRQQELANIQIRCQEHPQKSG